MKVQSIINRNGNAVANQFVITDGAKTIFQSYNSICCVVDRNNMTVTFGIDWDYSNTTMRHLHTFLDNYACVYGLNDSKSIRKAIKDGSHNSWTILYDKDLI